MDRIDERQEGWEDSTHRIRKIILPLGSRQEAEALLPVAEALRQSLRAQLIVLYVVSVPEGHSLSEATGEAMRVRRELDEYLKEKGYIGTEVRPMVRVAHELWDGIWETVDQEEADVLILGWQGDGLPDTVMGALTDPRLAYPPCNLVLVRPGKNIQDQTGWSRVQKILLPVRGGPQAGWPLRVAEAMAEALDASITVLHVTGEARGTEEERGFAQITPALHSLRRVTRSVTAVGDVPETILEEASRHDLIVMGASRRGEENGDWMGPILRAVAENTQMPLIVAKEASPKAQLARAIWEETLKRRLAEPEPTLPR